MGGLLNDVSQILPRPTLLPWQRNLRQIAYHRYLRDALTGGSQGQAIQ